ncbi:hypothetical protein M6B38_112145 [Iris pallida]|uniref:Uncharacterized protein n=1 Tax=Iris pallida TaxID=29817 RepID=A0AAX6DMI5_IRIPA|nr:hypothetical protein M6B38_112145 [Iris pallida]
MISSPLCCLVPLINDTNQQNIRNKELTQMLKSKNKCLTRVRYECYKLFIMLSRDFCKCC